MDVDLDLLEILMRAHPAKSSRFTLVLNEKNYVLENVSVVNSPTPVNSPTTRGGVYFSDKFAYKIKGTVNDLSIVPFLTNTMLGPNTEFSEIEITARIDHDDREICLLISANLTNSVQGPSKIDLNMVIIKLQSV